MIPHLLSIRGFLSYQQPVELDFRSFHLACISGPNGAGKSSLLDAITWALFGQARKRDDSVINTHPQVSAAEVVFTFEYESNLYRVQRTAPRGKTNLLEFHIRQEAGSEEREATWKPLTERTQRETQERIETTLGMDYETFTNASFFLQGKADQFTQQRPGDRKRILGSILNLGQWERYRLQAAEERKGVEDQVRGLHGRLDEIRAELGEESARKERLANLETELKALAAARQAQEAALELARRESSRLAEQRRLVDTLSRQAEASRRRLEDLQGRLSARQAEQQGYADLIGRAGQVRLAYQAWQESRTTLESLQSLADQYQLLERQRKEPQEALIAARSQLEHELSSLLHLKQQAETLTASLPGLLLQLEESRQHQFDTLAQVERREQLAAELEQARARFAELRSENTRLQKEMAELKADLERLSQPGEGTCPFCGQPLSEVDRQRLQVSLQAQGEERGDHYRQNRAVLEQADEVVGSLEKQIIALANAQPAYQAATRKTEQLDAQVTQVQAAVRVWEAESAPRLAVVQRSLEEENYALPARQSLVELEKAKQALGYDPAAHQAARQQEAAGRQAESELRELDKAQAAQLALEREISGLHEQLTTYQSEAEVQQAEYLKASAGLADAEAQAPNLLQLEQDLFSSQERENQLRMDVGAARQKVEVLADLKTRRRSLEAEQAQLNHQIARYKQLERAFGRDGVPALLIEQALPQIEDRANRILDRLSGGGMWVRFVTQAQYKDKKRDDLKETLDIQISDETGTRDYEMYSGGEAFRVNFAVRLALSEVLAQRAGARLQMLVIDEGFGSQDAQGRQRLVEAINLIQDDFAKILVITHIDELKDVFPNRIEVEKTSSGSQLRLA